MFTIDLLKGQGIPARCRPEGLAATAITAIVPVVIAVAMIGLYMSNRVILNIQRQESASCDRKIEELSDAMAAHRLYEQQKSQIKQRVTETAGAIDRYNQWSDVLVTLAENMPDLLVLRRMSVEQYTTRVQVPDTQNPGTNREIMVPARTLKLTLASVGSGDTDNAVREFRDRIRTSSVIGPRLEDIPVSQEMDYIDDQEVITYEMSCIFKPRI